MKRLALNTLAAVSLLAFGAAAVMWVRSWVVGDAWSRTDVVVSGPHEVAYTNRFVKSGWGRLHVGWEWFVMDEERPHAWGSEGVVHFARGRGGPDSQVRPSERWARLGVYWYDWPARDMAGRLVVRDRGVELRYWLLTLLTAPLPLWRLRQELVRRGAKRRLARGLCPRCGYDLRATPGRCPECGNDPGPSQVRCRPRQAPPCPVRPRQ